MTDAEAVRPETDARHPNPVGGFGWLRRRGDFVALRKAERVPLRDMILLCGRSPSLPETSPPRFGITVTRQTANAVGRNRIRRRLRNAIASVAGKARAGHDHVVLARPGALSAPFDELLGQLSAGLDRAARSGKRREPEAKAAIDRRRG
jgi:ribonuclease P protein component